MDGKLSAPTACSNYLNPSWLNPTLVRLSRIHFSSVGEKWMRDKRTPKDVCGEATWTPK